MVQPASDAMYARTRQMLRSIFHDKGMTVSFGTNEDGEFYDIDDMGAMNPLINVVDKLRYVDPGDWCYWAEEFFRVHCSMIETADQEVSEYSREELLARIRVRLMNFPAFYADLFNYAPELTPSSGLKKVLCIDHEHNIHFLTGGHLDAIDISMEELYAHAQRNVDASPIDNDDVECTARVRGIRGTTHYTAAKVINMQHLVDTIIGPVPDGVIFGIPHRDLIIYCVPTIDEVMAYLNEIINVVGVCLGRDEIEKPGGPLSGALFYWSPDGTYETLGLLELNDDNEIESFAVSASPELQQRLGIILSE